jgi:hypothetical protein
MKRLMLCLIFGACVGGLTASLWLTGCESNSEVQGGAAGESALGSVLAIEPNAFTFSNTVTSTAVFTATGGTPPYTWGVVETNSGMLSATGPQAVYTSKKIPGSNVIIVSDREGNSASATVLQL